MDRLAGLRRSDRARGRLLDRASAPLEVGIVRPDEDDALARATSRRRFAQDHLPRRPCSAAPHRVPGSASPSPPRGTRTISGGRSCGRVPARSTASPNTPGGHRPDHSHLVALTASARRLGRCRRRHREDVVQHVREPLGQVQGLEHDEERQPHRVGSATRTGPPRPDRTPSSPARPSSSGGTRRCLPAGLECPLTTSSRARCRRRVMGRLATSPGQGLRGGSEDESRVTRLLALELSVSCGTPALDVLEQARGLAVGELGNELLRNAKDHGPAENLRGAVAH